MTTLLDYADFSVNGESPSKAMKNVILTLTDLRAMDSFVYRLYGAKSFANDLDGVILDLCRIYKSMEKESDFRCPNTERCAPSSAISGSAAAKECFMPNTSLA